jgi:hypothetical protein
MGTSLRCSCTVHWVYWAAAVPVCQSLQASISARQFADLTPASAVFGGVAQHLSVPWVHKQGENYPASHWVLNKLSWLLHTCAAALLHPLCHPSANAFLIQELIV